MEGAKAGMNGVRTEEEKPGLCSPGFWRFAAFEDDDGVS
jgi:hypothetical protein